MGCYLLNSALPFYQAGIFFCEMSSQFRGFDLQYTECLYSETRVSGLLESDHIQIERNLLIFAYKSGIINTFILKNIFIDVQEVYYGCNYKENNHR